MSRQQAIDSVKVKANYCKDVVRLIVNSYLTNPSHTNFVSAFDSLRLLILELSKELETNGFREVAQAVAQLLLSFLQMVRISCQRFKSMTKQTTVSTQTYPQIYLQMDLETALGVSQALVIEKKWENLYPSKIQPLLRHIEGSLNDNGNYLGSMSRKELKEMQKLSEQFAQMKLNFAKMQDIVEYLFQRIKEALRKGTGRNINLILNQSFAKKRSQCHSVFTQTKRQPKKIEKDSNLLLLEFNRKQQELQAKIKELRQFNAFYQKQQASMRIRVIQLNQMLQEQKDMFQSERNLLISQEMKKQLAFNERQKILINRHNEEVSRLGKQFQHQLAYKLREKDQIIERQKSSLDQLLFILYSKSKNDCQVQTEMLLSHSSVQTLPQLSSLAVQTTPPSLQLYSLQSFAVQPFSQSVENTALESLLMDKTHKRRQSQEKNTEWQAQIQQQVAQVRKAEQQSRDKQLSEEQVDRKDQDFSHTKRMLKSNHFKSNSKIKSQRIILNSPTLRKNKTVKAIPLALPFLQSDILQLQALFINQEQAKIFQQLPFSRQMMCQQPKFTIPTAQLILTSKDFQMDVQNQAAQKVYQFLKNVRKIDKDMHCKLASFLVRPLSTIKLDGSYFFDENNFMSYRGVRTVFKRLVRLHQSQCGKCEHIQNYFKRLGLQLKPIVQLF